MNKKKNRSNSAPYIKGGTILIIVSLITTVCALSSYLYGTEEVFVQGGQGNKLVPAQYPKNFSSVTTMITTIGIGVIGVAMWIIGLINSEPVN
jgi:hypothetical protein